MLELTITNGILLALVGWLVYRSEKRAKAESELLVKQCAIFTESLNMVAKEAFSHMKAETLMEKVDADSAEAQAKIHVEQLTDAYHEEMEAKKKVIADLEEQIGGKNMVELRDGRKVEFSMLEEMA